MDFRLDRLATLYLVDPVRRFTPASKRSVPILMYHGIVEDNEAGVSAYYRTTTAPRMFAEQMAYLEHNGYHSLSLEEAVRGLEDGNRRAKPGVVITFDDGYSDFYTNAFPVLRRYGFTASVFLPTAYIGDTRLRLKGRDCLTWSEIRELQKYGISFGSHTVTHPQLRDLEAPAVEVEIVASKRTIEDKLGCAVESFAYPYAFPETELEFKNHLRQLLGQAGYKNGVCTTVGRLFAGSDTYFLRRLPVNSADDLRLFLAKLDGAYDWLAKPQYLVKWAKQRWGKQRNGQSKAPQ
jgi:peptidoglycan/xylan/chitin deacetylase (PgdA/CDA1 family)